MKASMTSAPGLLSNKWLAVGLFVLFLPLAWRAWSKLTSDGNAIAAVATSAADPTTSGIPNAPIPTPAKKDPPAAKPSPSDLALFMEQDQRREIPVERDPFRAYVTPVAAKPEVGPNLRLEGVSACGDRTRSLAVIGDRVLAEGEEIDGFLVEAISPEHVTLRRGERTFVLDLLQTTAALEESK
ncbi:MAG: hypothetical protein HYR85_09685 [Planctomycetes bacterium]|nr:hypothetical protein [Planctomycetota bacterium]MBI3847968.1 hypothetical protein [Planctomycetota bacterium]